MFQVVDVTDKAKWYHCPGVATNGIPAKGGPAAVPFLNPTIEDVNTR
jgi:hypothetical protein